MRNVYPAPLQGQHEITAFDIYEDIENKWKTAEGIYVKPPHKDEEE